MISAVHDVPMEAVARSLGFAAAVGQSPFALLRGRQFECSLFRDEALRLRRALIAHEQVHTIWRADDASHASVYRDRGHSVALTPLASYTVGAVAHCTVLRLYGSLRGDDDLWRCVRAVGTTTFSAKTCRETGHFARWARPCATGTAGCHTLPARP